VALQVTLQVGPLVEAPLADGALVRTLLQMGDLVDGQGAGLAETLAAIAALEGLVLGVNVPVIPQMILPPEGLAANVAGIGPLVRVGSLVDEQIVGLGELPVAVLADELLLWATAAGGSTTGGSTSGTTDSTQFQCGHGSKMTTNNCGMQSMESSGIGAYMVGMWVRVVRMSMVVMVMRSVQLLLLPDAQKVVRDIAAAAVAAAALLLLLLLLLLLQDCWSHPAVASCSRPACSVQLLLLPLSRVECCLLYVS